MNSRVQTDLMWEDHPLDRSILVGVGLCLVLLLIGIAGGGMYLEFFDPKSFLIVIGGTVGATIIHYSLEDARHAWKSLRQIIQTRNINSEAHIAYLVGLSQKTRTKGMLVLEEESQFTYDPFMKLALQVITDGQSPDDIRKILETEQRSSQEQGVRSSQLFETMGTYAPALGLIGTLIGLIQMLGSLNNPTTIGPAMALALVTTLYGAVAANLFFLPVSGKLRLRNQEDALLKSLTLEGAVSIAKQESSLIIEQRLRSFLPKVH